MIPEEPNNREMIIEIISITRMAALFGVSRVSLYYAIRKYDIRECSRGKARSLLFTYDQAKQIEILYFGSHSPDRRIKKSKAYKRKYLSYKSIYIIQCRDSDYYKIGMTGDVYKRLHSLQDGCPYELRLIGDWCVADACSLEVYIHDIFHNYRIRGEWYELSNYHLERLVNSLKKEVKYANRLHDLSKETVYRIYYCPTSARVELKEPSYNWVDSLL